MIFPEIYAKLYPGNYRAKIEEIDTTIKNGIYKVRIYPFMAELGIDFLPKANSTFTVRYKHIQLKVGDWVWVFFENQDCHLPVIFDLCNSKEEYPQPESGTYGTYSKFQFGNISCEFDESLDELTIKKIGEFEISVVNKGDINIVSTTKGVTIKAPKVIVNSPSVYIGGGIDGYIVTSPTPGLSTVASGMPIQSSTKIKASL